MSWLLIALGTIASVVTKPKPYKPSAEYIRINKELEKHRKFLLEPKTINLREILPTNFTTEEERLQAIKAWNDYYQAREPHGLAPSLSCVMMFDGYEDVAIKLGIEWFKYYDWIK